MTSSNLIDHIREIPLDLDETVFEMANLKQKDTGIENWVLYVSSKVGKKRPRVKLGKTGEDTHYSSRNSVFYFDIVELDKSKDHSGASQKIKNRVLEFLSDMDNNKKLLSFWNNAYDMRPQEIADALTDLNQY